METDRREKNILEKIIHDADCLDIARARPHFESTYLDFHKEIASKSPQAMQEMACFAAEVKSFVVEQGDLFCDERLDFKKKYQTADAWSACTNISAANPAHYPILHSLGGKASCSAFSLPSSWTAKRTYQDKLGITKENIAAAIDNGLAYMRAVASPSALGYQSSKKKYHQERLATRELRKIFRAPGIPTYNGDVHKEGNLSRSTTQLSYSANVYANAGLLILNPAVKNITHVSSEDVDTGRWKKAHRQELTAKDEETVAAQLSELYQKSLQGGSSRFFGSTLARHNEVEMKLLGCDLIVCTNALAFFNQGEYHSSYPPHPLASLLQAIYLQRKYARHYQVTLSNFITLYGEAEGARLMQERFGSGPAKPILDISDYTGDPNALKLIMPEELTDDYIVSLWEKITEDYLQELLKNAEEHPEFYLSALYTTSIHDLKTLSVYKTLENNLAVRNGPPDMNETNALQQKINTAITDKRNLIIKHHEEKILQSCKVDKVDLLQPAVFFTLFHHSELIQNADVAPKAAKILVKIKSSTLRAYADEQLQKLYLIAKQIGHAEKSDAIRDEIISRLSREVNIKNPKSLSAAWNTFQQIEKLFAQAGRDDSPAILHLKRLINETLIQCCTDNKSIADAFSLADLLLEMDFSTQRNLLLDFKITVEKKLDEATRLFHQHTIIPAYLKSCELLSVAPKWELIERLITEPGAEILPDLKNLIPMIADAYPFHHNFPVLRLLIERFPDFSINKFYGDRFMKNCVEYAWTLKNAILPYESIKKPQQQFNQMLEEKIWAPFIKDCDESIKDASLPYYSLLARARNSINLLVLVTEFTTIPEEVINAFDRLLQQANKIEKPLVSLAPTTNKYDRDSERIA